MGKHIAMKGILIIGLFLVVLCSFISTCSARTIVVSKDGNGKYTSIQAAIDAAESGTLIEVHNGSYNENIVIDKSVDLIGNGSESTRIFGKSETRHGITILSDWVNVSGFEIRLTSHVKLKGILIEANHSKITETRCVGNAYGIYLKEAFRIIISGNECIGNSEYGAYAENSDHITFSRNRCNENKRAGINIRGDYDFMMENISLIEIECNDNEERGISIVFSGNAEVIKNSCLGNGKDGIILSAMGLQ